MGHYQSLCEITLYDDDKYRSRLARLIVEIDEVIQTTFKFRETIGVEKYDDLLLGNWIQKNREFVERTILLKNYQMKVGIMCIEYTTLQILIN